MADCSQKIMVAVLIGALLALTGSELFAQSRKGIHLRSPGLRTVGQSGGSYRFSSYSYGTERLRPPKPVGSSNPLRSTINNRSSFSIIRSGRSGVTPSISGVMLGRAPTGVRLKNPNWNPIQTSGIGSSGGFIQALIKGPTAFSLRSSSFATIGITAESTLKDHQGKEITSLVPDEPSRYRDFMASGEQAFKAGDFRAAYEQFEMANIIWSKDPVSLLGMSHAKFAMSLFSYNQAAFHLRLALTYLPELPLVKLKLRALYGDSPEATARYTAHIRRLKNHLDQLPIDADGHLLLGYFLWFDDDVSGAQEALSKAMRIGRDLGDKGIIEAVSTFWDAMVAGGKVSGDLLTPPRSPAVTRRPAEETTTTP